MDKCERGSERNEERTGVRVAPVKPDLGLVCVERTHHSQASHTEQLMENSLLSLR